MLYNIERIKVAGDDSYVYISIIEDETNERSIVFDEASDFSAEEKNKLRAVVPIDGFASSTLDYKVCNITYDSIAIRVLVRREEK